MVFFLLVSNGRGSGLPLSHRVNDGTGAWLKGFALPYFMSLFVVVRAVVVAHTIYKSPPRSGKAARTADILSLIGPYFFT